MTLIMLFEFLIGLTDVYVAGRVGKDVQAAYGFVIQLYFMFIVIANALTVGAVSVVSRLYTSKDKDRLTGAIFSSLVATAAAGMLTAFVGIVFAPLLIKLLNIPAQLKPFCIPLIRIYSAGLLFEYMLINGNGILRSCDRIRVSLGTMAVVCFINIGLNIFFVFYTPLSFRGIALATASAAFIGSLVILSHVRGLMTGSPGFLKKHDQADRRISGGPWPRSRCSGSWAASPFSSLSASCRKTGSRSSRR